MLKLLIADDEKTIRETILSFINWEALDIEVVGTANNGIEAFNMFLDRFNDRDQQGHAVYHLIRL